VRCACTPCAQQDYFGSSGRYGPVTDEERAFYGEEAFDEDGYGDEADVYGDEDDVAEAATASPPAGPQALPQGPSTSDGNKRLVANAALLPKAAAAAAVAAAAAAGNGNGKPPAMAVGAAKPANGAPVAAGPGKPAAASGSGTASGAGATARKDTGAAANAGGKDGSKGKEADLDAVAVAAAPEPPRRHSWRKGLRGLRRRRDLGTGWTFCPADEEALMDAVRCARGGGGCCGPWRGRGRDVRRGSWKAGRLGSPVPGGTARHVRGVGLTRVRSPRSRSSALSVYERHPEKWRKIQLAGMRRDFSWARAAKQWEGVFESALAAPAYSK
jgi:hypothetical protein